MGIKSLAPYFLNATEQAALAAGKLRGGRDKIKADDAAVKAQEDGLKTLNVQVKGPGSGRETALRALQSRGFKILSIKDETPMPHNGSRPPKKRRV